MATPADFFVVPPNWADEVQFGIQWWTVIQKAITCKEKRSGIISKPVRSLSYTPLFIGEKSASYIKRHLFQNMHQLWGIPIWQDETYLSAACLTGDSTITVQEAAYRNFEELGYLIIYSDIDSYEVCTIDEISGNILTLQSPLTADWGSGVKVYPILVGRFPQEVAATLTTSNIGSVSIEFVEETVGVNTTTVTTTTAPPSTTTTTTAPPLPWLGTWAKRRKLTLSREFIDEDLLNFPVMLHISNASGVNGSDLSSVLVEIALGTKKIAVTTADGVTQCNVEIDCWSPSIGHGWFWVGVPKISGTAITELYLYYDGSQPDNTSYVGATGDTPAKLVWNADHVSVYHFNSDPATGVLKDSSQHGYPGSVSGTGIKWSYGKVGLAWEFSGNNHVVLGPGTINLTAEFTAEVVFAYTGLAYISTLINKVGYPAESFSDSPFHLYLIGGTKRLVSALQTNNDYNNDSELSPPGGVSQSTWQNFAVTYKKAESHNLYQAGVKVLSSPISFEISASGRFWACARASAGTQVLNTHLVGYICEVRISRVKRSTAWMKATHYSYLDGLVSFGAEESI
jgi:hypothetical protein